MLVHPYEQWDEAAPHMPRLLLTSRVKDFHVSHVRAELAGADPLAELRQLPPDITLTSLFTFA